MSYDYLMFKKPAWAPRWLGRARALLGSHDPIGSVDAVRKVLDELFPQLAWTEQKLTGMPLPRPVKDGMVWCGGPHPQFQVGTDLDGTVRNFSMARAEAREIRLVEKKLGVVAVDLQRDGILGTVFG